jgi:hypothetical protein
MAEPTSLFGPTALEALRASDLDFEQRTRTQAQLDPMAMNYASRINSARSVGRGINSLLGGQSTDPELRRAQIMDSVFKTLSPEELKNPAMALSIMADRLEEDGLTRDAADARMKSLQLSQQMTLKENEVKDSNSKRELQVLEKIARGANGILTSWDTQSPELQEQFYNIQVDMIAKELGEEAARPYRNVNPSERKGILRGMVEQADNGAARSREDIAQDRIKAQQQQLEMKLEQEKTKFVISEANKFKRDFNKYRQQDKVEYNKNLSKTVDSLVDRLKIEQDNLAMYTDPAKSPLLSEALRITNKNITNANILQIKKEIQEIGSMQIAAGERVYTGFESPTTWSTGTTTTNAPQGTTTSTTATTTSSDYKTDFANAQIALKNPSYNAAAILADFKVRYPNDPQPGGSAGAPAAVPPAPGAPPAAPVPSKPQTEAERREQIFLDRLNDRTPLEVVQDFGSAIAGGFEKGEKYFQEKRDAFNKDIDIAASVAKEKLQNKTFVSSLNPRQLKRLNEIANDSGAKHKAYQDSDTPYDALPLAGLSNVISKSASSILNKGSKILAAKAVRDATRTPSDIETNMAGLQDRLKRVEELERARKLKQIGDSDKEVLRQIKEEIKLMDQANESALKESLKNAETTAARKLAMEQRKRLADIRKEIKRVFAIAGSTPVPYKKPQFD